MRARLPRFPGPRRSSPNHSRGLTRLALWISRSVALLWAAVWIAFTTMTVWDQGWQLTMVGTVSAAMVLVPVLLAWVYPRFGGLVLLGLAVCAKMWFDSQTAIVGIAVPAAGLGAAFLTFGTTAAWQRWRTHRKALKIARQLDRA